MKIEEIKNLARTFWFPFGVPLLQVMALARAGGCLLRSCVSSLGTSSPALRACGSVVVERCLLKSPAVSALSTTRSLLTQANSAYAALHTPQAGSLKLAERLSAATVSITQQRGVVKWSHKKGKRKTVKSVVKRFMYLDWSGRGMWIRPRTAKYKRRWRQSSRRKARLNQHVFTNATQSRMLDKMATKFWRRQFHFIDDMYADFHVRDNFPMTARPPAAP